MKKILVNKNGTFKVLSSNGKDYYDVNQAGYCSCHGYGFHHGKCKHVDTLKEAGYLREEKVARKVAKRKGKWRGYAGTNDICEIIHDKKGIRVLLIPV